MIFARMKILRAVYLKRALIQWLNDIQYQYITWLVRILSRRLMRALFSLWRFLLIAGGICCSYACCISALESNMSSLVVVVASTYKHIIIFESSISAAMSLPILFLLLIIACWCVCDIGIIIQSRRMMSANHWTCGKWRRHAHFCGRRQQATSAGPFVEMIIVVMYLCRHHLNIAAMAVTR